MLGTPPLLSCVALGRTFGVISSALAPPACAQHRLHTLRGVDPELGAGRGGASREVTPKFLPRATQDAKFPPSGAGCGLRREGESFAACRYDPTRAFAALRCHQHILIQGVVLKKLLVGRIDRRVLWSTSWIKMC